MVDGSRASEPRPAQVEVRPGLWEGSLRRLKAIARHLVNLRASPHEIALGCAIGAFVSVTPLLGVQTILAILLAGLLRASVPAAIVGTFVGNPLSWPFIWTSTYAMGLQIVGLEGMLDPATFQHNMLTVWAALVERSPHLLDATVTLLWPLVWPMLAGSIPLGLLTGAVVYYICKNGVQVWRHRRMSRSAATE
jgi:uncharacterized protein (DUF2062 family)